VPEGDIQDSEAEFLPKAFVAALALTEYVATAARDPGK
jgi:hypothetical protein